jgi:hypothetical protein
MAVRQQFGHLSAGAARGLALRHGHYQLAPGRNDNLQLRLNEDPD